MVRKNQTVHIDIQNNPEFLELILNSIQYLSNGWEFSVSSHHNNPKWQNYPNKTARYFVFDFNKRLFEWAVADHMGGSLPHVIRIKNTAQLSRILESIYQFSIAHPKI